MRSTLLGLFPIEEFYDSTSRPNLSPEQWLLLRRCWPSMYAFGSSLSKEGSLFDTSRSWTVWRDPRRHSCRGVPALLFSAEDAVPFYLNRRKHCRKLTPFSEKTFECVCTIRHCVHTMNSKRSLSVIKNGSVGQQCQCSRSNVAKRNVAQS